jgi:hypothetical protein
MKTGTFTVENTDAMYVGMKNELTTGGTNRSDAIINWSDDPTSGGGGPDNLRFIFTQYANSGLGNNSVPTDPQSFTGLEIARMTAEGAYGRMGIGPLFTATLPPAKRLEVVDDQNRAQLRLTYTQDQNPLFGSHTDFFEDGAANLNILPTVGFFGQVFEKFVGINTTAGTPTNTLEIQSGPLSPYFSNGNGSSGLKFRNLTANNTPVPNQGNNGVLALDVSGNVIYVPSSGGGGFFGYCTGGGSLPQLSGDAGTDLFNHNFYFARNFAGSAVNNVIIGNTCGYVPQGKLDVLQSSGSTGTIGINVLNTDQANNGAGIPVIGIKCVVNNSNTNCHKIAGWFEATPATCAGASVQYAIIVPPNGGYSGFGTINPGATVHIVGTGLMGGTAITSDASLKTNVEPLSNSLSKIRQLRGISFNWIPSMVTDDFMSGNHFGFIAQEVEPVFPDIVRTINSTGTKTLAYQEIIPVAVEAIKELDLAVTALQNAPSGGVSGTGTTNYLTKWGGTNTITSSNIVENGTNVGIGTSAPTAFLDIFNQNTFGINTNVRIKSALYDSWLNIDAGANGVSGIQFLNDGNFKWFIANSGGFNDLFTINDRLNIEFTTGNVGIGTVEPTEKLYVNGNIFATGTITQNSDANLKENQTPIVNASNIISRLTPKTFNFKTVEYPQLNLPSGNQYGLIAQEVETVLPELITSSYFPAVKDSVGNVIHPRVDYKGINYTSLIPILIQAAKEQQEKINQLESTINTCCSLGAKSVSNDIPSSDATLASGAVLYQNHPNPYTSETSIRYFVPENSMAVMTFFDEFGNEIKSVELPYKGQTAELNLTTINLASGIYSYSLIVNGKMVDTKKMVKTK